MGIDYPKILAQCDETKTMGFPLHLHGVGIPGKLFEQNQRAFHIYQLKVSSFVFGDILVDYLPFSENSKHKCEVIYFIIYLSNIY